LNIDLIAGARPNFMKIGPIYKALQNYTDDVQCRIVHTGQHYDQNMSEIFFKQLDLPEPHVSLEVGSGTHAVQTGKVMVAYEELIQNDPPDLVLVVGDVNSTMACALVATKLHIPVGHVEAGLRSRDMSMPEEVNRIVADRVSSYLFTTCEDGVVNLIAEGFHQEQIIEVGNTMIDSLAALLPKADESTILEDVGVKAREFVLVTLHRPSNVDDPGHLEKLLGILSKLADRQPVLFPVHPRTRKKISDLIGFEPADHPDLRLLDPMPYLDFVKCQKEASVVLTDSGGVQEETSFLGVPCITARENTERPVTITRGTNLLVGVDPDDIFTAVLEILDGNKKEGSPIPMWDGHAGERIASFVNELSGELETH